MRRHCIQIGLVMLSSAYAHWLAEHKDAEPDHVWAEVALGTAYTLVGARLLPRPEPPAHWPAWLRWLGRDAHIYAAFAYAGTPIIIGELAQWRQRQQHRKRLAARWGA